MSNGKASPTSFVDDLYRQWKRLGVAVTGATEQAPVDVESLILTTASHGALDERIFVCAASWLNRYHVFVDGRRLSELSRRLPRPNSSRLGVLLTLAAEGDGASGKAPSLETALSHCKPLSRPQPFYEITTSIPALTAWSRDHAHPLFRRWGYWHDDVRLKLESVRPLQWLLEVPELRIRALMGPSLESSVVALTTEAPSNARQIGRRLGVSYSAVHAAVERLVGRGIVERRRNGVRQDLTPSILFRATLPVRSPR